ncbi:DUF2934 domain-containing protein [Methylorubrum sp. SB2]|uniref:DUF2934 domain-containing protein n=1 Tax=Methylorubrum subtropicum TaxID=3138812 RepID=UPI00313C80D9
MSQVVPPITPAEIRQRAYELWERNHSSDGFEVEFWLLAERELRAERQRQFLKCAPIVGEAQQSYS